MPTYITLYRYTEKGAKEIKKAPARLTANKEKVAAMGINLKGFYLTMGRYDLVTVFEAPDDETAAKVLLTIGMQGNVSSETLRAFDEDEFRQIVAALP